MNEQEILDRARRAALTVDGPEQPYDALLRRRDRKRRNQRIAAGVVGIAVFVAAVWIVTSGMSFDRSTPAVPGGSETGPTQIAPPPALASGAPDAVTQEPCSDGARARLEVTNGEELTKVRFEVHRSPGGHEWRIRFVGLRTRHPDVVFFRGTRVASDGGDLVVQGLFRPPIEMLGREGVRGKALDRQTGEFCNVKIGPG